MRGLIETKVIIMLWSKRMEGFCGCLTRGERGKETVSMLSGRWEGIKKHG